VEKQLARIECRVVVEPCRKNTAPAIAYALDQCKIGPQECVIVVPSDHLIEPEDVFLLSLAMLQARADMGKIITFGIRPTRPETGYGYIETGSPWDSLVFSVKRFVEKPDRQRAGEYILQPRFFWNSGMFLMQAATFWRELDRYAPSIRENLNQFSEMPNISIDYAMMEQSKEILLYPLAVSWSDVGSWDSVYEVMAKDSNQNVTMGRVLALDTKNSLIIGNKRIISTIGLDDLIIIETEEAILISKKGESERVKALLEQMKKQPIS
jgi:mannose-1-phosphate guanylyltransferase/mannose-6-phosphate isomerase